MLLGNEQARVFTPPLQELTEQTTAGFSMVTFAEEVLHIKLYPWQKWFLIHAFEFMPGTSKFRFRTIVLLVARQNGKSTIAQVISLFFMYVLQVALVLGTAQNLDVAEELWADVVSMAQGVPELTGEVDDVVKGTGKKALVLTSGSRYKVQAANRRGGRGLSADLVLLDELREHSSWEAWGAITKTTMARSNAVVLALSNAGDYGSVVLTYLRMLAHRMLGDPDNILLDNEDLPEVDDGLNDDGIGLFEWSAHPNRGLGDLEGWAEANPSLGHGELTLRALQSAFRTDPADVFATECLCRWVARVSSGPFPDGTWAEGQDSDSSRDPESKIAWALDVSWDRSHTHIIAAGWRPDGVPHVEVVASRAGTAWAIDWLADREASGRYDSLGVVVQSQGAPAASLVPQLKDAGLNVVEWRGADLAIATGDFYDRVARVATMGSEKVEPGVYHRPQPVLDQAAATAATKTLGDSWLIDRAKSPVDAAPLIGAIGAIWLLTRPEGEKASVSAYQDGDLLFVD